MLPPAISSEPTVTAFDAWRTWPTTLAKLACMAASEASTLPGSAWAVPATGCKSPWATWLATSARATGSAPNWRTMLRATVQATAALSTSASANALNITLKKLSASCIALWLAS